MDKVVKIFNPDKVNNLIYSLFGEKFIEFIEKEDGIYIKLHKPIHLITENFSLSVNGETNIISKNNINIDSLWNWFGSVINLNSHESSQIKNFEESINAREKARQILLEHFKCEKSSIECPCEIKDNCPIFNE